MITDHEHYEILCVLAATGEISDKEVQDLRFHVAGCRECRSRLSEYGQVSAQFLPMLGERRIGDEPPQGMNERFVETARRHGLTLRPPAGPSARLLGGAGPSTWRPVILPMVVCVIVVIVSVRLHRPEPIATVPIHEVVHSSMPEESGMAIAPVRPMADPSDKSQAASDAGAIKRLEDEIASLKKENDVVALDRERLSGQVSVLSADLASAQQEVGQRTADAESAKQQLEKKRELELQNLAVLAQDRDQIANLQTQLAQRDEDLKRYSSMLSVRDQARELIVARNLHIIDVHDADGSGDQQVPFGRIFYTEGKSLVFYAYDLPRGRDANPTLAFHVWGGEQGKDETPKSLGVFRSESNDGRWVLTCDDPHVLAQVDTVFVTAEKGSRGAQRPTGKRILYAFLGDKPNHP